MRTAPFETVHLVFISDDEFLSGSMLVGDLAYDYGRKQTVVLFYVRLNINPSLCYTKSYEFNFSSPLFGPQLTCNLC